MSEREKLTEQVFTGLPTAPGIAIGEIFIFRHDTPDYTEYCLINNSISDEVDRLKKAVDASRSQLRQLYDRIQSTMGESIARIFLVQSEVLEDADFIDDIINRIESDKLNAEAAVHYTTDFFKQQFEQLDSELMRQKAQDIRDIGNRLIQTLLGSAGGAIKSPEKPMVLVSDDLLPSDVLHLLDGNILAIATDLGGVASHTAILTRALDVPAVVGLKTLSKSAHSEQKIIVNGNSGKVFLNPSEENLSNYRIKQAKYRAYKKELSNLGDLPSITIDNRPVHLYANVELPQETKAVISYGAEGIGLFRSEYLFLTHRQIPNEMEQFAEYKKVIGAIAPKVVTIRTYDLGGDKIFPELPHPVEANPFMGWRAIRVGLDYPLFLKTQLRAILRASAFGNVKIMFPFVSGLREIRTLMMHYAEAKQELHKEGIPYNSDVKVGIMIELPSAVMLADELAREVDFFSIGTNDLAQFTLAVDRGNELVSKHFRHLHPALLRMIKMTVDAAHRNGIDVAICGELAASPLVTLLLTGLGLDQLSMSPAAIPEIKKIIRSITLDEAQKFTDKCLSYDTAEDLHDFCLDFMKRRFADLPIWFNGV